MCCGEYIIGIDSASCSRNHLQQLMSELAAVAIAVRKEQRAHEWLRPTGVLFTCVATYKACVMSNERAQSVEFRVLKIAPLKWQGTWKPMSADIFNHLLADTRCKAFNYLHLLYFNVSGHFQVRDTCHSLPLLGLGLEFSSSPYGHYSCCLCWLGILL